MSTHAAPPQDSPLHRLHAQWGGRMTDFAGWRLPLSYPAGTLAEHSAARNAAALFDVSHMAQIAVSGPAAAEALAKILPANVPHIAPGKSKYAVMLNHSGGAIDDLIVANDGERGFFIVSNAARRQEDLAHLRQNLPPECQPQEITNRALVALQGPKAAQIVAGIFPASQDLRFMESAWLPFQNDHARVSRTGYTGEDGFEISVANDQAEALCAALTQSGVAQPAGLGARDTLRTEAALCLYGHELTEDISPIEAGLTWTIPKARRESGGFIGFEAVRQHLQNGVAAQACRAALRRARHCPRRNPAEKRRRRKHRRSFQRRLLPHFANSHRAGAGQKSGARPRR